MSIGRSAKTLLRCMAAFARLLPVSVWLMTQVSMAGAVTVPIAGGVADQELRAVATALGLDGIVLCTPDGAKVVGTDGEHSAMPPGCEWCKAFALVTVPDRPDIYARAVYAAAQTICPPGQTTIGQPAGQRCKGARAPPIRS